MATTSKQKRILIFVHDGRGLGHLRRLSRIATRLQGEASVLFITGHRDASYMVPKNCEYVHLPSLDSIDHRRSKHWGRRPFLEDDIPRGRAIRKEILAACMETFDPHGFISDYLPLGMDSELAPLLASTPTCRKYFVIRGIMGDPTSGQHAGITSATKDILLEHYDKILVTCDKRIVDVAKEYSLPPELTNKLVYTGYAVEPIDTDACAAARTDRLLPNGATWVVCSAGGGKDGEDLLHRCWELALQYPECYFDLIVGPRSRISLLRQGWYGGTRIRIQQSDEGTMPQRLGGADVVICRGGYNSLMEAAVGNAQIIVAPIQTDFEQRNHARRLSAFRPIHVVDNIDNLDLEFEKVLNQSKVLHQITDLQLDGLETSSRFILSDLAQVDAAPARAVNRVTTIEERSLP